MKCKYQYTHISTSWFVKHDAITLIFKCIFNSRIPNAVAKNATAKRTAGFGMRNTFSGIAEFCNNNTTTKSAQF